MQDALERREFELVKVRCEYNPADVLTRPVPQTSLERYLATSGCEVARADSRPEGAGSLCVWTFRHIPVLHIKRGFVVQTALRDRCCGRDGTSGRIKVHFDGADRTCAYGSCFYYFAVTCECGATTRDFNYFRCSPLGLVLSVTRMTRIAVSVCSGCILLLQLLVRLRVLLFPPPAPLVVLFARLHAITHTHTHTHYSSNAYVAHQVYCSSCSQ